MYTYTVKVKSPTYLWGSGGVTGDLSVPLVLTIHNDLWGDPIQLSSDGGGNTTDLGTLQPGECWTIPLLGLHGVRATCEADSSLTCTLESVHLSQKGGK
jgi:hypothetical protein